MILQDTMVWIQEIMAWVHGLPPGQRLLLCFGLAFLVYWAFLREPTPVPGQNGWSMPDRDGHFYKRD
jgi:hypothetical protein